MSADEQRAADAPHEEDVRPDEDAHHAESGRPALNARFESNDQHGAQRRSAAAKRRSAGADGHSACAARLRLFCAVELPAEVRARAFEHIERLRERLPQVRAGWERAEKLHLTLKFFGDVEESRVQALSLAIERAAKRAAPFTLIVAEAGAFPPRGPARVLWLGIRDVSGNLARLHTTLEDECAAAGFEREQRTFHPHLTIARLRNPSGARSLAELHSALGFEPMALPVNELVLMKSELGPRGSAYTQLAHHGLAQ